MTSAGGKLKYVTEGGRILQLGADHAWAGGRPHLPPPPWQRGTVRPWRSHRTPPPSATYIFSSEAQSSLSIASASCCRSASSVPTSCPGREGGLLTPGARAIDPAPRLPGSRSRAHGAVYRARAPPGAQVLSAQQFSPGPSLPRPDHRLRRPPPPPPPQPPSLERRLRDSASLPARPLHQSETGKEPAARLLVDTSSSLRRRLFRLVQSVALPPTTPRAEKRAPEPQRAQRSEQRRRRRQRKAGGGSGTADAYQDGGRVQARLLVQRPQHRHPRPGKKRGCGARADPSNHSAARPEVCGR